MRKTETNMKMLVANVGSSSFKCQLLEMPLENVLAQAKVERIGSDKAPVEWTDNQGKRHCAEVHLADYVSSIRYVLDKFTDSTDGVLKSLAELDAVAFKPLTAGNITGAQYMTDEVLEALEAYSEYIAPMHNRFCMDAVKSFRELLDEIPLVGLFETFFFQDWPEYARIYGIPWDWTEKYDVRRTMGHSCSHWYANQRVAELKGCKPEDFNAVELHLGGSSSLTAVKAGKSIDGSGQFTMQAGPLMSVRSSDMDGFLIAYLWSQGEGSPKEIVERMMTEGGIASISGMGFDMRDLEKAYQEGNQRAQLAVDTYVYQVGKYVASMMYALGDTDVITFAGGTGEASPYIRRRVLEGAEQFGVLIDDARNEATVQGEGRISRDDSKVDVWVVRINEELVVARQCYDLLCG